MAALFADEDFPGPAVPLLRALGHDVLTTQESGLAGVGTPDSVILATASALGRAVVTMNRRNYIALHASVMGHAGIVVCRRGMVAPALADRVHAEVSALPSLAGRLVRVNRPNLPPVPPRLSSGTAP